MKWIRRLVYLVLILIWLAIMIFPTVAFTLARRGEMNMFGRRAFLLQTDTFAGVGFQWERNVRGEPACEQVVVVYVAWEGEGEPAVSCACTDGIERVPEGRQCVVPP